MDFACGITAGIVVREDEAKALLLLLIVRVFGGGRTVSRDPERRHSRPCAYIPPVQVPTNLCSLTSPSPRLLFCLAFTNGDLSIDRFCSAAAHTVATPTRVDLQVAARFERPIFTALTEVGTSLSERLRLSCHAIFGRHRDASLDFGYRRTVVSPGAYLCPVHQHRVIMMNS